MTDELKSVIIQVITSWQVIGVMVALALYFSLIFYVVQFRHTTGAGRISELKSKLKQMRPKKEKPLPEPVENTEELEA